MNDATIPDRSVLRRGVSLLGQAVRTHPVPFFTALAGATVFAFTSVGLTTILGRVTNELILPAFKSHTTGRAIAGSAIAIVAVTVLKAMGVMARRYYCGMTSNRMQATWRNRITDTYLAAPLSFYTKRPTGELMAHADSDALGATEAINPLPFSISAVLIAVIASIRLITIDPILALVGLVLFPLLGVANRLYTTRVEEPAERVQARFGDLAAVTHESLDGALVVKTLGLGAHETDRLADAADRLRSERLQVGFLRAAFEPALNLLPSVGIIALLALGSRRISVGALSTGELVEAMALFGVLTLPMRVLGYLLEELPRAVASVDRLNEVLATAPAHRPDSTTARDLPEGPLEVRVEHLAFAYDAGTPVLADLTFTVRPGEIVAVTGATASGKSTLCLLLAALMPPDDGRVVLGGIDVSQVTSNALHDSVATVFQDTFLFADSVTENIIMGTDASAEMVRWATGIAQADRFINALPEQAATVLGERGVSLSGGQRQRLALARALVRRPRLLLLDDATSAVDPRVEQRILSGLREELDMTTVVVAHRVSTITLADRVLFLDNGVLVASGPHTQLLAEVPSYAALVRAYEEQDSPPDTDYVDDLVARPT